MNSWIRRHRIVLILSATLIFCILAGLACYLLFGHKIVEAWYGGKSFFIWKGLKTDRSGIKAPLDVFLKKADTKFKWLFVSGLLFTLFMSLFGFWVSHLSKRRILLTTSVLITLILGLFLITSLKIDILVFEKKSKNLLKKIEIINEKALSFKQEKTLEKLKPNQMNGFFYRFDDHLKDAAFEPSAMPQDQKPSPGAAGFQLEFDGTDRGGFEIKSGECLLEKGLLKLKFIEGDYFETQEELNIDKESIGDIEIRIKLKKGKKIYLGWSPNSPLPREDFLLSRISVDTLPDSTFHIYQINARNILRRHPRPGETIRKIFFIPSNVPGDEIEIDYIRLISKKARYGEMPIGEIYETINKEMRRVIYTKTPFGLEYSVKTPGEKCFLDFGLGILETGDPVTFRILARSGNDERLVFSREISDNSAWNDSRIDFSAWAGESVEIRFETESKKGNIGFWSNPLLYSLPKERLNIIILLEDALRADHLSCYGYERETTPVKDRFIRDGILFLNAFSQATETRPSVATIMTSLYPSATGVWNIYEFLDEKYLTMAEIMRHQGFNTASFIQNSNAGPSAGLQQGYSFIFDEDTTGQRPDELYGQKLNKWLEENKDRNFFLYLHVRNPHGPYDPRPPFDSWYKEAGRGKILASKDKGLDPESVAVPTLEGRRLLYDGEVRANDYEFEKFLGMLNKHDLLKDTALIFMADHGEHLGEDDLWGHLPPGLNRALHVPLLIVFPKELPRDKKISQPVQLIDIMPTILDLAQINRNDLLLEGDSLLSLMQGNNLNFWESRFSVSEEIVYKSKNDKREWASIFYREWHIINSDFFVKRLRPFWLPKFLHFIPMRVFDFLKDRKEEKYLNSFYPDLILKYRVNHFLRRFQESNLNIWKTLTGGTQALIQYDPEVQERLRALGYIR